MRRARTNIGTSAAPRDSYSEIVAAAVATGASALQAQDDQLAERAKRAGEVLSELTSVPDSSPPKALLNEAVCVAVVPGVVQAGFGIGGKAGFWLVSCRTGRHARERRHPAADDRQRGAPAIVQPFLESLEKHVAKGPTS